MPSTALVIDDSATVRAIIALQLGELGLTACSFTDGISAFNWLTHSQIIPAFALIDVNLPKINGYQIVRRLKSLPTYSTTAIVLMSSNDIALDEGLPTPA